MLAGFRRFIVKLILCALIVPIVLVVIFKFINPPFWGWELSRALFPPKGYPEQTHHQWVDLSKISKNMQLAVIASEDQTFPEHHGIDLNATLSVLEHSGKNGPSRGASTISQQTAKNVFLFPSHSFIRKGIELYFALWMEIIWGKDRILETYLNVIEFGPGIYGVQAASEHFFHIPASRLSAQQAAQLAAVLPNPYKIKASPMSNYVYQRTLWIRKQMRQLGMVTLNKVYDEQSLFKSFNLYR
ncbi:monofunctional biosynthetic peptidoglycan transglycosylase [Photobacterium phosphoreum]|jgi:monofunctional biosynthetic peptidoglycan transglycosylase|uniref:Biosynthetic peptidoglycan transglycosylase n=1 Tax=Photobacterium phosphoreum TaxID=659 RepID=A0AAW4ZX66_PHOPO|nr:monofunctional biosynthetic peptidoglycan transglycosylase [Photobacterium phosphoreum]KJF85581.1 peptidoglycan transglycosylase [Photobacterium phosphoreum]MCD9465140.1 monofunctional biosynthetic peptidoglycan transglycosylase [Photobacterium phosphoreum]MCD9481210.1 monofunctional biosynthetic peptidoglycan transglycosylase [Photobacterium phosphoreum]MCD9485162.1 monofunctional biosynthetic peptidoglycan transglycosylase [Photobacterium phosphoreum]MCD9492854.1 monofunctional biosynthet